MKRFLYTLSSALCLLLCAVLLCSCFLALPEESGASEEQSAVSDTASEESGSGQEASAPGDDSDRAEFLKELPALMAADAELTRLIACGGIYEDESAASGSTESAPLSSTNKYRDWQTLAAYAASCYTDGGDYMLSYPEYGPDTVKNRLGSTWYTTHFTLPAEAATLIDGNAVSSAVVTAFDSKNAGVRFVTAKGDITLGFTLTENGWRLDSPAFAEAYGGITAESPSRGMGSASELNGKCLIINLFIDSRKASWDADAVGDTMELTNEACEFITETSKLYTDGLTVISSGPLYMETDMIVPTDMNDFVWIDLLFADTIYRTPAGYAESHFELDEYDNWCLLIHLNEAGRSYALACNSSYSDWGTYESERCVVFHTDDTSYGYYDCAGTYAHEIMHLFGANDLYSPYITDEDIALLGAYFANDIMSVVPTDLGLASVSPYTAYLVGWVDSVDAQFAFLCD